jgi:oligoribonuclease (3'-5' exoribonuclease)
MEYISIDIETTGLGRENDQTLEIGAIIENTHDILPFNEIPKFHAIIQHDRYSGSAYAINMNQRIFKILADYPRDMNEAVIYASKYNVVSVNDITRKFYNWCYDNLQNKPKTIKLPIKSVVAGKNFTDFDKPFLNKLPDWTEWFQFDRRVLDPGILFTDFMMDQKVPSLGVCLERAKIKDTVVTHDAIQDAWQVIEVLRTKYGVWGD